MKRAGRRWVLGVVGVCVCMLLCIRIVYGGSLKSLESYMTQADKHVKQCSQYAQEKKYAQSEEECTQAIIMLEKALDIRSDVRLKKPEVFDIDFSRMAMHACFNRGISLYHQGDLHCAWVDIADGQRWGEFSILGTDIAKKAEQIWPKIVEEMEKTGRRGREDCPLSLPSPSYMQYLKR